MKNSEKIHDSLSWIMMFFILVFIVYVIGSFPLRLYKYTIWDLLIFGGIALLLIIAIFKTCPSKEI